MKNSSLGLIEVNGYGTAISAADEALKAAAVKILRLEPTIGAAGSLGVTLFISGDVAAVKAAIEAAQNKAEKLNTVSSVKVIPNLDEKVKYGMYKGSLNF